MRHSRKCTTRRCNVLRSSHMYEDGEQYLLMEERSCGICPLKVFVNINLFDFISFFPQIDFQDFLIGDCD